MMSNAERTSKVLTAALVSTMAYRHYEAHLANITVRLNGMNLQFNTNLKVPAALKQAIDRRNSHGSKRWTNQQP